MSGVFSCILQEDLLTMALSNPALQDLYFLFDHNVMEHPVLLAQTKHSDGAL